MCLFPVWQKTRCKYTKIFFNKQKFEDIFVKKIVIAYRILEVQVGFSYIIMCS